MSVSDREWPIETGYGIRCFLLLAAVELAFAVLGRLTLPHNRINAAAVTFLARTMDMILIGLFLRSKNLHFSDLGLNKAAFRRGFFHASLWAVVLLIFWFLFTGFTGAHLKIGMTMKSLNIYHSLDQAIVFFVVILFGPAVEEVVFRGWLYGALRNRLGTAPSVFISSVLFSLAHGKEGSPIILTFLGGILFSLSYEKSRSLVTPMILHSGGNAFLQWWFYNFSRS
jgi:membrane protease YdiL (CAAX protease family)